jgi:NADPH:quinone reductase-like Zn-dependent oxidoreductase
MFAVYAEKFSTDDPLSGLVVGERPDPEVPDGWTKVTVKAASLNHHDLWTLRGVGISADQLPMVLGCDAAGVTDDGSEVIVHAVISSPEWRGDETLDPRRTLLSERYDGTFAEQVVVPARNVVPKPPELTFTEAACLPTAWLTAYRMLIGQSGAQPGSTVLVQGAGGGVASAAIAIGHAAGYRMWATSRSEAKRAAALALGADAAFESGARLPERVDAVLETVGAATWLHSVRSVRSGGTIVVSGATSGASPPAALDHVFFRSLRIIGSTMGTREELERVTRFVVETGVRPTIDSTWQLADARSGFARLERGDAFGKVVFLVDPTA